MRSKLLLIPLILLPVFVTAVIVHGNPPTEPPQATPVVAKIEPLTVESLYAATEAQRAKVGAKPLIHDARLDQSAQMKADDMKKNHYFAHANPTTGIHGNKYITETTPYNFCANYSENIADNTVPATDTRGIVSSWMHSKPHREALLNQQYEEVGFGISGEYIVAHYCDSAPN